MLEYILYIYILFCNPYIIMVSQYTVDQLTRRLGILAAKLKLKKI